MILYYYVLLCSMDYLWNYYNGYGSFKAILVNPILFNLLFKVQLIFLFLSILILHWANLHLFLVFSIHLSRQKIKVILLCCSLQYLKNLANIYFEWKKGMYVYYYLTIIVHPNSPNSNWIVSLNLIYYYMIDLTFLTLENEQTNHNQIIYYF